MHPDKGSRSVRTDVLTDSETIYEAYVRVLNSLHRKATLSGVCVSLSIFARCGEIIIDIYIYDSLNRKVSRSIVGVSLRPLKAEGGGEYLNIYNCYVMDPIFSYNFV